MIIQGFMCFINPDDLELRRQYQTQKVRTMFNKSLDILTPNSRGWGGIERLPPLQFFLSHFLCVKDRGL